MHVLGGAGVKMCAITIRLARTSLSYGVNTGVRTGYGQHMPSLPIVPAVVGMGPRISLLSYYSRSVRRAAKTSSWCLHMRRNALYA